jgi:hypothetical protein
MVVGILRDRLIEDILVLFVLVGVESVGTDLQLSGCAERLKKGMTVLEVL